MITEKLNWNYEKYSIEKNISEVTFSVSKAMVERLNKLIFLHIVIDKLWCERWSSIIEK